MFILVKVEDPDDSSIWKDMVINSDYITVFCEDSKKRVLVGIYGHDEPLVVTSESMESLQKFLWG